MTRRQNFKAQIGCLAASIYGSCLAMAEKTKFYWPGKYSEKALRSHLAKDSKHRFPAHRLQHLTFQDLINLHDWHHSGPLGMKGKTPFKQGKQIGKIQGEGPTTVDSWPDWLDGKEPGKAKMAVELKVAFSERYKVTKGDNLWNISQHFRTTPKALREANGLESNVIYVGQILLVP